MSNGEQLAMPSSQYAVRFNLVNGGVFQDSYIAQSNIYLPEFATPIATMVIRYIYSIGISNIRVADLTTGELIKELNFKSAIPSDCENGRALGITELETTSSAAWVAVAMECASNNYVFNLKLDL